MPGIDKDRHTVPNRFSAKVSYASGTGVLNVARLPFTQALRVLFLHPIQNLVRLDLLKVYLRQLFYTQQGLQVVIRETNASSYRDLWQLKAYLDEIDQDEQMNSDQQAA